jgi:hypothetical protein
VNSQQQITRRQSHKPKTKNRQITEASSANLMPDGEGDAFRLHQTWILNNKLCECDLINWKQRIISDEDITTSDTTIPSIELQGPITRSWAQQLHCQVNSFLCSSANNLENRLLPNDLIVIRNQGVYHGEHARHQEGAGEWRKHAQHVGSLSQFGIQESDFESNSESRTTLPSNWCTGCVRPPI